MGEDLTLDNSAVNDNAGDSSSDHSSGDDSGKTVTLEQQLQKERSSRGREVSSLRQELSDLKQTIESLTAGLSNRVPEGDGDKPPVDYITTPEELERYNTWKATKEEKRQKEYALSYVKSARSLGYLNPELNEEIQKVLLDGNIKYSSFTNFKDPEKDAMVNYRIAESTVLKNKIAEAKGGTAFRNKTGGATGTTVQSDGDATKGKVVELDEFAKKFIEASGEKVDAKWVQDSVQRTDIG